MEQELQQEIAQLQAIYDTIINFFVNYSFQIVGALIILIIGVMIANRLAKFVSHFCESKGLDVTLSRFLANIVRVLVMTMVGIICLGKLGISVTPFIAAIGAVSLGAGLALQGLLSNYGAGLNIILVRPFIVGDTISVQGVSGQVKDIRLANTILSTEDEVEITIPNKHIVGEILHNTHDISLVELSIGVAYSSDMDQVGRVLEETVNQLDAVSQAKPPQVGILGFGDSSVDFEVRAWVDSSKINAMRFEINKAIWDVLKQNQIEIPFPQREVRQLKS